MLVKLKLYLIIAVILAGVGGGLYWKYQKMQKDILTLTQNNAILDQAVKDSESAVQSLQADNARMITEITTLNKSFQDARNTVNDLRGRLARHDIGVSAVGKPALTEKVLNNATKNVNRCMEVLTGAPLTEAELNATKRSQINPECPWIHPNYNAN